MIGSDTSPPSSFKPKTFMVYTRKPREHSILINVVVFFIYCWKHCCNTNQALDIFFFTNIFYHLVQVTFFFYNFSEFTLNVYNNWSYAIRIRRSFLWHKFWITFYIPCAKIRVINQALSCVRTHVYTTNILSKSSSLSSYCHYRRDVWNITLRCHGLKRDHRPRGGCRFLRSIRVNLIFVV